MTSQKRINELMALLSFKYSVLNGEEPSESFLEASRYILELAFDSGADFALEQMRLISKTTEEIINGRNQQSDNPG